MSAIEAGMLINGEWRTGIVPFEDRDPHRTEQHLVVFHP